MAFSKMKYVAEKFKKVNFIHFWNGEKTFELFQYSRLRFPDRLNSRS